MFLFFIPYTMTETYTLDDKNEKQSPQKGTEQLK
jgi:hypothetical protein